MAFHESSEDTITNAEDRPGLLTQIDVLGIVALLLLESLECLKSRKTAGRMTTGDWRLDRTFLVDKSDVKRLWCENISRVSMDLFLRSGRGLWWTTCLDKAQSYHCCASQTEIYSSGARVVPVENNGQPGSASS